MRQVETRIIAELMKNCRRSDRELAKAVRVSQPTASRLIKKLESKGLIREYAAIPDFPSVGFELMAVSFFRFSRQLSKEKLEEARETAKEFQTATGPAVLMVMSGMGMGFDRVVITLHRNYSEYHEYMRESRELVRTAFSGMQSFDSFIVDLCDKTHFLPLTLKTLAENIGRTEMANHSQARRPPRTRSKHRVISPKSVLTKHALR